MSIFTILKQPVSRFSNSLFRTDKSKYLPPNPRFEIVISLADLIAYLAWLCVRQIILLNDATEHPSRLKCTLCAVV